MKVWLLEFDDHIPEACPTLIGVYSSLDNAKNACDKKQGEIIKWETDDFGGIYGELYHLSKKRGEQFIATYRITEASLDKAE